MRRLTLRRFCYSPLGTFGKLTDDLGDFFSYTVEEVWNDNRPSIPGKQSGSCIPEGIYICRRGDFPTHKDTFEVTNVPNRTAILIHPGNTINHVEGCIAPGNKLGVSDNTWAVLESRDAYERLKSHLHGVDELELEVTKE